MTAEARGVLATLCCATMAACHAEPFTYSALGAVGPLTPAGETRLTYNPGRDYAGYVVPFQAYAPTWSEDGRGILYSFSPRPEQVGQILKLGCQGSLDCVPVPADEGDTCYELLPAHGGSAPWDACETAHTHSDSTDILSAGAENAAGQLLYIELTGSVDLPPGIGYHSALWIADPFDLNTRRKVVDLFRDVPGQTVGTVITNPSVNWFTDIAWTGANTFMAIGHVRGSLADTTRGLVLATIAGAGLTAQLVPGTNRMAHYGMLTTDTVVYADTSLTLHRVAIPGGASGDVATLPLSTDARILDVSCHPGICVVLTTDPRVTLASRWALWTVDPATGDVVPVREFDHAVTAAKLSPVSGDVVVVDGANLFLINSLVR